MILQKINIHQEKALKEFKNIWNDYLDGSGEETKSDEEAINICISIAAMFMSNREARKAFWKVKDNITF